MATKKYVLNGRTLSSSPINFHHDGRYSTFESDREVLSSCTGSSYSPIRMLALCRVLMGKIFVSAGSQAKAGKDTEEEIRNGHFDSVRWLAGSPYEGP